MMPTDPTRRSALSVALLAHTGTDYDLDAWMAGDGQANGSVRFDTDRAWFTIQGRPAALRELAEALVRCAELTEQTDPPRPRSRRRRRERLGRLPAADLAPTGRLGRPARDPAHRHRPGGAGAAGRLAVQRHPPPGLGLPARTRPDRPGVAAAYLWLGDRLGREGAERLIVAAAFVVAMVTWTREPLAHALFRSHLRRRWALACRHAELATLNDRIPRITRCRLTRAGEQLRVRVPAGGQVPDLEAQAERIAAFLGVREVRVVRDPASARHARVVVLRRDPLADPTPIPWPLVKPTAVAVAAHPGRRATRTATEVTVTLPERNLLLGGEPGAGKSNVLQLLVAVGALDPSVRLTLFDPKLVELAVWQGARPGWSAPTSRRPSRSSRASSASWTTAT